MGGGPGLGPELQCGSAAQQNGPGPTLGLAPLKEIVLRKGWVIRSICFRTRFPHTNKLT